MSVSQTTKTPKYAEQRQTVVVKQSLVTLGAGIFSVNLQQHQVSFVPTKMIIRQIIYCNVGAGSDAGIFVLWCSIPGKEVAACYVGIQSVGLMSESVIPIPNYNPNIDFYLNTALAGSFGSGTNSAPTGFLTLVLEFL